MFFQMYQKVVTGMNKRANYVVLIVCIRLFTQYPILPGPVHLLLC